MVRPTKRDRYWTKAYVCMQVEHLSTELGRKRTFGEHTVTTDSNLDARHMLAVGSIFDRLRLCLLQPPPYAPHNLILTDSPLSTAGTVLNGWRGGYNTREIKLLWHLRRTCSPRTTSWVHTLRVRGHMWRGRCLISGNGIRRGGRRKRRPFLLSSKLDWRHIQFCLAGPTVANHGESKLCSLRWRCEHDSFSEKGVGSKTKCSVLSLQSYTIQIIFWLRSQLFTKLNMRDCPTYSRFSLVCPPDGARN